ncbi:MAG: hypothetical protein AAF358_25435 [Pseudomonadota bacterium]
MESTGHYRGHIFVLESIWPFVRRKSAWAVGPILLVLGLCAGPAAADPLQVHRYHLTISEDLKTLAVRAELASRMRTIRSRNSSTAEFVSGVKSCAGQPLKRAGRNIELPSSVSCVTYRFDLAGADASERRSWVRLAPSNLLIKPSDWLFRPRVSADSELELTIDLPPGVILSVPWPAGDSPGTYRLTASPASSKALLALGTFEQREIAVPGALLRASFLRDDVGPMDVDKISAWLKQAASGVALAHGRFPNPNPQVLVVPVRGSRSSPVPFGRVIRDGGEAVQFFVDPDRSLDDLLGDWTATHEFAHLLLPYVKDRWVSEGFASYYQNVLMGRSGYYTELKGWIKLHAGIERARAVRPLMSPVATSGRGRKPRMMVYWSGSALALLGDVRQRQLSGGEESLEVVLGRMADCCLPSAETWDAERFFARLDELSEHKVWMALYRQHAKSPGIPDLTKLYQQLGIEVDADGGLTLDDNAPQADLRRALMGPAPTAATVSR